MNCFNTILYFQKSIDMSFGNPVEGYFLITSDNLIFEVKGIVHPQDRIIAYLRYVSEDSASKSNLHYRKLYDLNERYDYLNSRFPEYLWLSKVHGRVIQSVPKQKIASVLAPVEGLAQMKSNCGTLSRLEKATVLLVERLVQMTGIAWSDIGITGSQLLGISTDRSDIDLVVYGSAASRKFYELLSENYGRIAGIKPYSGNLLNAHVRFRWSDLTQQEDILNKIESKKVLQGLFDKYEFFVRLVKHPEETDEFYGKMVYEMMGACDVRCRVEDDHDSIFTPCIYIVESHDCPDLRRLISFRGRFTEQVSVGMSVRARGRLERVTDITTGDTFQQLVLGENSTDYLLPDIAFTD